jgi:hypothetical protein
MVEGGGGSCLGPWRSPLRARPLPVRVTPNPCPVRSAFARASTASPRPPESKKVPDHMEVDAGGSTARPVARPRPFPSEGVAPGPRCGHTLTSVPDLNRLILFGAPRGLKGLPQRLQGHPLAIGGRRAAARDHARPRALPEHRRCHGSGGIVAEEPGWHHHHLHAGHGGVRCAPPPRDPVGAQLAQASARAELDFKLCRPQQPAHAATPLGRTPIRAGPPRIPPPDPRPRPPPARRQASASRARPTTCTCLT